jgi:F0F1-type ATP synthase membrane subunit b/b'
LTVNLLLADAERQTANAREAINQSIESASRQYTRNIKGLEAQRDTRRNQLQSNINQAYNQIPSLASVILNTATQGLSSYAQVANL